MKRRRIQTRVRGQPTSDGAGVRLSRVIGTRNLPDLDPFLMLDEFGSEIGADYIAGFPDHPHRGFETVTIMLNGSMHHQDHLGNSGYLRDGSVQWMTAGRGIIHSEMPEQTEGLMRGFQLWVNLPASLKMCEPRYQDIAPEKIPTLRKGESNLRIIAGRVDDTIGPIEGIVTHPILLDIGFDADDHLDLELPDSHRAFVYCYEGEIEIEDQRLETGVLGVLDRGDTVVLSGHAGSRVLIGAGLPLGEPIARYGPFVMNTEAEIRQALEDYRTGRLVQSSR